MLILPTLTPDEQLHIDKLTEQLKETIAGAIEKEWLAMHAELDKPKRKRKPKQ